MMKLIFSSIVIFLLVFDAVAQNECIEPIKAYNAKFMAMPTPMGKQVYALDYTTDFYYWEQTTQSEHINTKLYIGENHMHYLSNFVDIYTDEYYMATVMKREKKIILTYKPEGDSTFSNYKVLMKAREQILDSSKVVGCSKNERMGELVLDTRGLNFPNFFIEKMSYEYNLKTGDIGKVVTEYSDAYELKKMVLTNHNIDFNSRYSNFKSVKEILMKKNGALIDKYKDYEIITD